MRHTTALLWGVWNCVVGLSQEDGSQGEASSADPVNAMAWRSQMLAYAPFLELQRFGRWKVQRFSGARASNGTR